MRSQIFAAVSALAASVMAYDDCMSSSDALKVANNFGDVVGRAFTTELATNVLAPNFADNSDSVISLINSGCTTPVALGTPTFTSRDQFISSQAGQPASPFAINKVWNTCDTVFVSWYGAQEGTTQPNQMVTGLIVLETIPAVDGTEKYQIETVYSEFNSGAFLYDLGIFKPNCSSS